MSVSGVTSVARGRLYASGLLAVASAGSAALGWCALLVVAHWATPSTYVAFAVLWALYYAVAGSVSGLQLEVTRWIVVNDRVGTHQARPVGRWGLFQVAGLAASVTALAVLASFPWWRGPLDAGYPTALFMAAGALSLTGLMVVLGVLGAQGRWLAAALILAADAVVRLACTVLVAATGSSLAWYALAIISGSMVWLPLLLASRSRLAHLARSRSAAGLLGRASTAILSTAGAAVLIAGLPWLYALTSTEAGSELSAGLIAAIVLFRSPVLVLAQGVRPAVLRELASASVDVAAHVRHATLLYAAAAVALSTGAYVLGPALLRASFGDSYTVSEAQAAGLALSAAVLAYVVHLSAALVAVDQHRRGTEGWLVAVLATVILLVAPIDGTSRLMLAAVVGPLVGAVYMAIAWDRAIRRTDGLS